MSISGISSNLASQNIASIQNQQQRVQQQFQSLAQEFQSASLSTAQTTAVPTQALQASATSSAPTSSSQPPTHHGGTHFHHRMHAPADTNPDNTSAAGSGESATDLQSTNPATAVSAYNALAQNLQQLGSEQQPHRRRDRGTDFQPVVVGLIQVTRPRVHCRSFPLNGDEPGAPFLARSLREKACPEPVEGWGFCRSYQSPSTSRITLPIPCASGAFARPSLDSS